MFTRLPLSASLPDWKPRCEKLVHALNDHISSMAPGTSDPFLTSDHESRISVHCSMIICIAAKADLCHTLAKVFGSSPSKTDWRKECELALRNIVSMTSQLTDDDMHLVDPFVSVSILLSLK